MTRVNALLLAALVASSVYLVRMSYESRRLFTELHRAHAEERRLDTEYERLKTERQAEATPMRVEKTAREKLAMRPATPALTHYVGGGEVYGGIAVPAPAARRYAAAPQHARASSGRLQ